MKNFRQVIAKNFLGRWETTGRTYELDTPPPYREAKSSGEHQSLNSDCLMLFERMLRAGESDLELDGSDSGHRPYFMVSPGSVQGSASRQVYHAMGKVFGHIFEGEMGIAAKPEHIRINGSTIINPAVLDGIPSTVVTPIPVLLMAFPSKASNRSKKSMVETAALLGGGP